MSEPGFTGMPVYHLDPTAQEFFPTASAPPPPPPPQVYYSYPPPPAYDNNMVYPPPPPPPHFPPPPGPAFISAAADVPPPLPPTAPPALQTPSRTLLLSMVPSSVSESTVRRELEVFGDVRSVQMERRREGLVTVHFYDVRAAEEALAAIQEQHMQQQFRLGRHYEAVMSNAAYLIPPPPIPPQTAPGIISGRVVWARFVTPVTAGLPDGNNQGTLVVFNLNPAISSSSLREIFQRFGLVRELRETPMKRTQRFVEFYDVRDAATAMAALNRNNQILGKTAFIEFSRPGGLFRKFWKSPQNQNQNQNLPASRNLNLHPNPNHHTTTYSSRNPTSFSRCLPSPTRPSPVEVKPPIRPRWRGNPSGSEGSKSSSSGSSLHESVTNLSISECSGNNNNNNNNNNRRHKKMNSSKKSNAAASTGGEDSKQPSHGGWKGCGGGGGRRGKDQHDPRFLINEDTIVESNCRDLRTTVMIKNIPNKYSQKLLLNMLDNHCIHCNEQMTGGDDHLPLSSYDFVYLPIDFINKCNVGYGFVNMTSPEATLRLYKAFHHQSWEVFNSRKICQVTYARLQGLDALREHFKNSKFPSEAEEYMPVVFNPPRDGRILTDPAPITGCIAVDSARLLPLSQLSSSAASSSKENESDEGLNGHIENSIYDDDEEGYGRCGGGCSYDETDM